MNYEELLRKYIRHVKDEEGISFIDRLRYTPLDQDFTEEERQTLERLEKECS